MPFQAQERLARYNQVNVRSLRSEDSSSGPSLRYLGTVLPPTVLQINQHIQAAKQYQVYGVTDLMTGEDLEAFVYPTRNLTKNQRRSRDDSLKKETAAASWNHTFDFDGLKFCIFSSSEYRTNSSAQKMQLNLER